MCESPDLVAHIRRPWFLAYAERKLGEQLVARGAEPESDEVAVGEALFSKHCLVLGSTGSGKTRIARLLLSQMLERGYSAVAFVPKYQDVLAFVSDAQAAGIQASRLYVVSPTQSAIPGWNVLDAGVPLAHAAGDLATVIEGVSPANAPRMSNLIQYALLVVGAHRLSVFELMKFLQHEAYRLKLMDLPLPSGTSRADRLAYQEAADFFTRQFAAWTRSEQAASVAPALTRLGEISRSWFLQALFAAGKSTINLASFWQEQQALIIHNDAAMLGSDTCARFLTGAFMSAIFRTAMREPGDRPVVLAVDELASTERLVGRSLIDILTVARAVQLRLICGLQYLGQASDLLRQALFSQTAVQLFGRLGGDARLVAASLAAGTGSRLNRVVVESSDKPDARLASVRQTIFDRSGRPLKLSVACWQKIHRQPTSHSRLLVLRRIATANGIGRLYVRHPLTNSLIPACSYVEGLRSQHYALAGPRPLSLVMLFPQPKFTGLRYRSAHEREMTLVRVLQSLPTRHVVARVAGGRPMLLRIRHVPDSRFDASSEAYLAAAGRYNGHSSQEIEVALARRRAAIDQTPEERTEAYEEADGSIF